MLCITCQLWNIEGVAMDFTYQPLTSGREINLMQYHCCLFKLLYSQIHRLVKAQSLILHSQSGSLFPPSSLPFDHYWLYASWIDLKWGLSFLRWNMPVLGLEVEFCLTWFEKSSNIADKQAHWCESCDYVLRNWQIVMCILRRCFCWLHIFVSPFCYLLWLVSYYRRAMLQASEFGWCLGRLLCQV